MCTVCQGRLVVVVRGASEHCAISDAHCCAEAEVWGSLACPGLLTFRAGSVEVVVAFQGSNAGLPHDICWALQMSMQWMTACPLLPGWCVV